MIDGEQLLEDWKRNEQRLAELWQRAEEHQKDIRELKKELRLLKQDVTDN